MHEMALCESILQLVEENATTQGYSKVKKVWLEIGALSGGDSAYMGIFTDMNEAEAWLGRPLDQLS